MEKKKWKEEEIEECLRRLAGNQEIPKSLEPDEMKKKLLSGKKEKRAGYRRWYGTAAAACLVFVIFAMRDQLFPPAEPLTKEETALEEGKETETGTTYEQVYQTFSDIWKRQEKEEREGWGFFNRIDGSSKMSADGSKEAKVESVEDVSSSMEDTAKTEEAGDYGKTNVQEKEVEEADIIKNDGRYLYQVISSDKDWRYHIQITDTKGGLKEISKTGDFSDVQEIYVWKDKLVVFEEGWAQEEEPQGILSKVREFVSDDIAYEENSFLRIHVYDIKNRKKPEEYHTFTVKGSYKDSRISGGYLYLFAQDTARKPREMKDYKDYIPMIEEKPIPEKDIILSPDTNTPSYLIMASIDMEKPEKFTDTKAFVTSADRFYVSTENIYVTDEQYPEYEKEENYCNSTKICRFSYKKGKMKKEAEGTVKGVLMDDMALSEKDGYLRLVTTVDSEQRVLVTDDISGEELGYETTGMETSNSLYILDKDLKTAGKIENLAKDERIYSARFMGNTGYFVTFRETDPLFSADLSDPKHPKILGELKISGFSEYLHFYGKDLLLGIGMEADESSGETQGLKLSMFDIADPSDVQEKTKLNLSKYDSSQALYDYKEVFIDTDKNLFGFSAQGYEEGPDEEIAYEENMQRDYLLFSYENGEFQQVLKVDCSDYEKYGDWMRGTYIGEHFYLLCQNGRIEEYSLESGELTGEL